MGVVGFKVREEGGGVQVGFTGEESFHDGAADAEFCVVVLEWATDYVG